MNYLVEVMPQLLQGATTTLKLFIYTILGSLPLGVLLSFGLASRFRPLQWILRFYVWIMRGTPLLLQLIFVFYGLPLVGIIFDRFEAALFAFILNYAAYYAEIFPTKFFRESLCGSKTICNSFLYFPKSSLPTTTSPI